jgi:hypothetical protein
MYPCHVGSCDNQLDPHLPQVTHRSVQNGPSELQFHTGRATPRLHECVTFAWPASGIQVVPVSQRRSGRYESRCYHTNDSWRNYSGACRSTKLLPCWVTICSCCMVEQYLF